MNLLSYLSPPFVILSLEIKSCHMARKRSRLTRWSPSKTVYFIYRETFCTFSVISEKIYLTDFIQYHSVLVPYFLEALNICIFIRYYLLLFLNESCNRFVQICTSICYFFEIQKWSSL